MTNTEQRIDAIFKRLQTEEFEPLREFLKSQLDAEFSSLKKIILFNISLRVQNLKRKTCFVEILNRPVWLPNRSNKVFI